jgi:hypothetical protein
MASQLPNFFIIGAAKSGTTSLHEYLAQHPEIHMSFPKELNFFSFLDSPPNFSGPPGTADDAVLNNRLRREKYGLSITTWSQYRKVFAGVRSAKAIGESSVSYLYFPQAGRRIRQFIPDARLIAILRNPVDRAYSKYRQLRRDRAESLSRFEQAVAAEEARMRDNWSPAWFYVDRGFYYRQLEPYYDLFPSSQIKIIIYDDFTKDPKAIVESIFSFLGVATDFRVDFSRRYNISEVGNVPRNILLYDLAARSSWVSTTTRAVLSKRLLRQVRPIVKKLVIRETNDTEVSPLTDEARQNVMCVFREDIRMLQDLIQRDLSCWL